MILTCSVASTDKNFRFTLNCDNAPWEHTISLSSYLEGRLKVKTPKLSSCCNKVEVKCGSTPRQEVQDVREVFWRTDSDGKCATLDCWAEHCALLTVELNSETDICPTTIHRALTPSEMQTCHLDVKCCFITLAWKKGLHKQLWVRLCRFKTFVM